MTDWLLGLSYGYHDSGVALLRDGEIEFAAQEERFTRIKNDHSFPKNAIRRALDHSRLTLRDIKEIYYYEDAELKFDRITQTYKSYGLQGAKTFFSDYPRWKSSARHLVGQLRDSLTGHFGIQFDSSSIHSIPHHLSHASSAFYPSPFEDASILCVDGVGEWATTSAWVGRGNSISPLWEIQFPHSIGLLYSAITHFCGFKADSGEYKVMGLAPYGRPRFAGVIRDKLIDIKEDGSFWLNMEYFDFAVGDCMVSDRFATLFGGPRREPEALITPREFDLAASVQAVIEEAILRLARTIRRESASSNLCLAGGVALNCVANGKLLRSQIFDQIWIQPAAGDGGGALGAALQGWHGRGGKARDAKPNDSMQRSYLGTAYSNGDIKDTLDELGATYAQLTPEDVVKTTASLLAEGNVVGWFQGRMEFGPRALGGRSILGDARNPTMQSTMNLKIKYRESFRPFAPAVLEERASEWFELDRPSPYMLLVVDVHRQKRRQAMSDGKQTAAGLDLLKQIRSEIPAVTHVDMSARVQTVSADANPLFYKLLREFESQTSCPVLINTSFNVRGEPIVESPTDAYRCFMRTEIDCLVIGDFVLKKTDQPAFNDRQNWQEEFALD